jgi:hypothetical protein
VIHWFLDADSVAGHSVEAIQDALDEACISYTLAQLIDEKITPAPDRTTIMPYGNVRFIRAAAKYNWDPGVFSGRDELSFSVLEWNLRLGERMLNHRGRCVTIGEMVQMWEQMFVRPTPSDKRFGAFVCEWSMFEIWRRRVLQDGVLGDDTPIMVAPAKDIDQEIRFFVVDGRIVTGSIYRNNGMGVYIPFFGSPFFDDKVLGFAQECIDVWGPDHAYVMDVCRLRNGELYIVEFNCYNSSGLYESDSMAYVRSVR